MLGETPNTPFHFFKANIGTISSDYYTAVEGTTITLSNTPDSGYSLSYYTVNGTPIQGNTFVLTTDVIVSAVFNAEYNPLNLPPYTVRFKYRQGITPTFQRGTAVLFDAENNIWDWTYESSDWSYRIGGHTDLLEVLGANSTNVTNMSNMFQSCSSLNIVHLFDTTNVTNMGNMFYNCRSMSRVPEFNTTNVTNMKEMFYDCRAISSVPMLNTSNVTSMDGTFEHCIELTTVPLFDTSKATTTKDMFRECSALSSIPLFDTTNVTSMQAMFESCINVQSGALALYKQASRQATPPTNHTQTFRNCGSATETGSAELKKIPSSWK